MKNCNKNEGTKLSKEEESDILYLTVISIKQTDAIMRNGNETNLSKEKDSYSSDLPVIDTKQAEVLVKNGKLLIEDDFFRITKQGKSKIRKTVSEGEVNGKCLIKSEEIIENERNEEMESIINMKVPVLENQQEEILTSLQIEEILTILQQEETMSSLQQKERFTSLQKEENFFSLQQEETLASLQNEETFTSLQQEETMASL